MPGPGSHLIYALGGGQALAAVSGGRFSPHHCLVYAINAFFGPDLGSFSEWLASTLGFGHAFASLLESFVHHPFYYFLLLGLPLSLLYSWVSRLLLQKGLLDSVSGVPLTRRQCLFLVSAGSLSHFFLDHLFEVPFSILSLMAHIHKSYILPRIPVAPLREQILQMEENGHSSMYTWILSTGWWEGRAAITPDGVVVVGLLCTGLICGFIYINRAKPLKSVRKQSSESMRLILIIAILYCSWCASQIYLANPRRPAVGEEADLGVLVFLGTYFFLPHWLCIVSMSPKDHADASEQLPR